MRQFNNKVPLGSLYVMLLTNNIAGLLKLVSGSPNKKYIIKQIIDAKYMLSYCNDIYNVLKSIANNVDNKWEIEYTVYENYRIYNRNTNIHFSLIYDFDYKKDIKTLNYVSVSVNGTHDLLKKDSEMLFYYVINELNEIKNNIDNIKIEQRKFSLIDELSKIK